VVVEALPKDGGWFSFGAGRVKKKDGDEFGTAEGTCGMHQNTDHGMRYVSATGFGQRVIPAGSDKLMRSSHLTAVIGEGSRLALHLSPRGAEGRRTLRFFAGGSEAAVFVDIEDDGGDSDWVAGVTLSADASVRLVPAEGFELLG